MDSLHILAIRRSLDLWALALPSLALTHATIQGLFLFFALVLLKSPASVSAVQPGLIDISEPERRLGILMLKPALLVLPKVWFSARAQLKQG